MTLQTWLAFVGASAIVLIIPGPTILTATSYAMTYGRRIMRLLVAAVALGDSTGVALSLLGLGRLLAASSIWFDIVKWAGAVYLMYLGVGYLRRSPAMLMPGTVERQSSLRIFASMYAVTASNPKGIVFYVGFMPQFIDPACNSTRQLWTLGVTFIVLATLNAALYTAFAFSVREWLASRAAQRACNLVGGSVLVGAGLWALASVD